MASEEGLGIADIVVFCVLTAAGYFVGLYFSFKGRRHQVSPDDTRGASAVLDAFLGGRSLPCSCAGRVRAGVRGHRRRCR
ncbi:hypothetical protein MTO96_005988 [Rhipicephalus appendiculatus]